MSNDQQTGHLASRRLNLKLKWQGKGQNPKQTIYVKKVCEYFCSKNNCIIFNQKA
jgi:hypothetical protein